MDNDNNFVHLATPTEELVIMPSENPLGFNTVSNPLSSACLPDEDHHQAAAKSFSQSSQPKASLPLVGPLMPPSITSPLSPKVFCLCMRSPGQPMATSYDAMPFQHHQHMHATQHPFLGQVQLPSVLQATDAQESQPVVSAQQAGSTPRTRKRSRNWEAWEALVLIQAKKAEFERFCGRPGGERLENSAQKYKKIVDFLKLHRVMDRDATACKNKWEALSGEYKIVKEWDRKPMNSPYSSLSLQERKQNNLPMSFEPEAQELMDTFQGSRQHVVPVVDSTVIQSARGSQAPMVSPDHHSLRGGDGGEGSTAENDQEQMLPPKDPDIIETWASGKRKRSCGNVVAAFQELSESMIQIEKDRADRARDANEMAKGAHLLECKKFEFLQMKMEREEKRAEKFVGVLGSIAEAFHKMAQRM